jgi:hypothetical protein
MKTKKLIKKALKNSTFFSKEEILYFKNWLYKNKKHKPKK